MAIEPPHDPHSLRHRTYRVIFEHATPAGRGFDVLLLIAIVGSVFVVMLESVASLRADWGRTLVLAEWLFTAGFTVEYVLRLWSVRRPLHYVRSFFGVVDLLSILPTWLSLVIPGGQALSVVRILRVVRVFRVLKLAQYVGEASVLLDAMRASRYKVTVFLVTVVCATVCVGSVMYLVEGPSHGFTSIPVGIYWAIVTLTTVGFGDVTPQTPLGQFLASLIMILGYGIIAVPTGIVSAEIAWATRGAATDVPARTPVAPAAPPAAVPASVLADPGPPACPACLRSPHDPDATHCKWCGARLRAARDTGSPRGDARS